MVSIFFFNLSFYNLIILITFYFIIKLVNNLFMNSRKFYYNNKVVNSILILSNSEIKFFTLVQLIIIISLKTVNQL